MGAALAALLSATYQDTTAITFQSPPVRLFAERLLLKNTQYHSIFNYGVISDPIFTGKCKGVKSACGTAGFVMESACHLGNVCEIKNSDGLDISTHRLNYIMDNVLPNMQQTPNCYVDSDCKDCENWIFV